MTLLGKDNTLHHIIFNRTHGEDDYLFQQCGHPRNKNEDGEHKRETGIILDVKVDNSRTAFERSVMTLQEYVSRI